MTWGGSWGTVWGGDGVEEYLEAQTLTIMRSDPQWAGLLGFIAEVLELVYSAQGLTETAVNVRTATAVHLDLHGVGLGQSRAGLADAEYRQLLAAKHAALFRRATPQLSYELAEVLTEGTASTIEYSEAYPAGYEYEITGAGVTTSNRWEGLLRRAKPPGVSMTTTVVPITDGTLRFDVGPGYDIGAYAYTVD